jgi:hypothetical protein
MTSAKNKAAFEQRKINLPLLMLFFGFCLLISYDPNLFNVVISAVADAYLQVSTFVAATLLIFFSLEKIFNFDLSEKLKRAGYLQVPIAAALGALPGCGGAIIVITRYLTGNLSFGAVLATLTATMGDAAFLLIAKEPTTGLFIVFLGFFVGSVTGWTTDKIHGPNFLRPQNQNDANENKIIDTTENENSDLKSNILDCIWMIILIPSIVIGFGLAFQFKIDELLSVGFLNSPTTLFGFSGGVLCLIMWLSPRLIPNLPKNSTNNKNIIRRTISDTNFVTTWVVFAFLLFEITNHVFDFELNIISAQMSVFVPLIGVLAGFLPGCGPQIIITTLYLSGTIPMSALVGNAISNDGDALFPAIALAPKVALVATLYSGIPALIIAYFWFLFLD